MCTLQAVLKSTDPNEETAMDMKIVDVHFDLASKMILSLSPDLNNVNDVDLHKMLQVVATADSNGVATLPSDIY